MSYETNVYVILPETKGYTIFQNGPVDSFGRVDRVSVARLRAGQRCSQDYRDRR